jgi:hypothetical protein
LGRQRTNIFPNDGNEIRQECRLKSHQRQTVILAARLGVEAVSTLASSVSAHEFMDATPYGYSLLRSAKPCSHVACTCSWTRTAFGCTDDSDNIDSIFVVPAWCDDDETAMEGLLPINQSIDLSMEQSTERAIEESEQSIDRAQEHFTCRRPLKSNQVQYDDRRFERLVELRPWSMPSCSSHVFASTD